MSEEINYRLIATRLWELLDDIDTAFDNYKPDMQNNFVNYVDAKVRERQLYAQSKDGHNLWFAYNRDIPIIENLDPMCRWFKDAWRIEKDKPTTEVLSERYDDLGYPV